MHHIYITHNINRGTFVWYRISRCEELAPRSSEVWSNKHFLSTRNISSNRMRSGNTNIKYMVSNFMELTEPLERQKTAVDLKLVNVLWKRSAKPPRETVWNVEQMKEQLLRLEPCTGNHVELLELRSAPSALYPSITPPFSTWDPTVLQVRIVNCDFN